MRTLSILVALAAAQLGAAWAIGDMNTARPGGSFSTVEAESAASCERLCVDDALCMAWSFRENICELKAVVPASVAQDGTISGVSPRAPASLRTAAGLGEMPVLDDVPVEGPASVSEAEALAVATAGEDDISDQLLGGLDDSESLQLRLGN